MVTLVSSELGGKKAPQSRYLAISLLNLRNIIFILQACRSIKPWKGQIYNNFAQIDSFKARQGRLTAF